MRSASVPIRDVDPRSSTFESWARPSGCRPCRAFVAAWWWTDGLASAGMRSILRSAASEPLLIDQAIRVLDAFVDADRRSAHLTELVAVAARFAARDVGVDDADGRLVAVSPGASTIAPIARATILRRSLGPRSDATGTVWMRGASEDDAYRVLILDQLSSAVERLRAPEADRATTASADELVLSLIDATSPLEARHRAARRLGINADESVRAVALATPLHREGADLLPLRHRTLPDERGRSWAIVADEASDRMRASTIALGVGCAGDLARLPVSAAEAERALRFTAADEHGRRVWLADDLAGLQFLANETPSALLQSNDVIRLRAALSGPRAAEELAIFEEIAWSSSVRTAAVRLGYHHSSLAARMARLSAAVGFSAGEPANRVRLQSALLAVRLVGTEPDFDER